MTDWTAATPTLANGEYPTSYLLARVPGAPDVFKQVPIARFVTADPNGNVGVGVSAPLLRGDFLGTLGARTATYSSPGSVYLDGQASSPVSSRIIFGTDNSGWRLAVAKNAGGTITNLWAFHDGGGFVPQADNQYTIGLSSNRCSVIYAASGSINTSDEREKRDIDAIPDDWLDAWGDVEWVRFRFNHGNRWHVGLVAQRVHAAFAARGLDAFAIGLCCHDRWDEEREPVFEEVSDGNTVTQVETGETRVTLEAGDRWGLRYDECFAMESAWHRREVKRQDARLAALEGR